MCVKDAVFRGYYVSIDRLRIVFLNAWSGRLEEPMGAFLEAQAPSTDIFCFQEADGVMPDLCTATLPDFHKITAYKQHASSEDEFPQANYVKEGLGIIASKILFQDRSDIGLGIYTQVAFGDGSLHLCNMHGISRPVDKRDNPPRLAQSDALIQFFDGIENPEDSIVIGGDLNLSPDTQSIQIFSKSGYRDLISDYGIATTRNHYAWDRFPATPHYHSDYVFTKGASVADFGVAEDLISDHLAMVLEVERQAAA